MLKVYQHKDISLSYRDSNKDDIIICNEVIFGDCYNTKRIFKLIKTAHKSEEPIRILDMGANIGTFSALSHANFPEAEIHSYEMHPMNLSILKKNVEEYSTVHHVCLTDVNYYNNKPLSIADAFRSSHSGGSFVKPASDKADTTVYDEISLTCEILNLDEVMKDFNYVDLIKMDIEAQELVLLPTAKDLHKIQCIVLECHDMGWWRLIEHKISDSFITSIKISEHNPKMGYIILWNANHGVKSYSPLQGKILR